MVKTLKIIFTSAITASVLFLGMAAIAAPDNYQGNRSSDQYRNGNDRYQNNQDQNRRGQGNQGRGHAYGHQRYRAPSEYKRPDGYRPHSWNRGERLPASYLKYRYRVDYSDYRLQKPPRDHKWIRVNNDVLMTNMETRRIAQVVRNLFY